MIGFPTGALFNLFGPVWRLFAFSDSSCFLLELLETIHVVCAPQYVNGRILVMHI